LTISVSVRGHEQALSRQIRTSIKPSPWASSLVAHGLCLVVGQGDILRCDIEFTVAMEMLDRVPQRRSRRRG
jgi:hypothetical protein